ncbi:uncharacterized protein FIBRA_08598 [Fibroporia radiculosa]|uniref:Uncharacterized protein n=1 Tax=Fibroporia radiculosa TaxID=599839 RepID=J4GHT0_9APHY|nr:uncharacterized protein FIBRA_08598 [Fibroporia radiculosa]CCM06343.1 predicted protein [Fibroporia radiculosa]
MARGRETSLVLHPHASTSSQRGGFVGQRASPHWQLVLVPGHHNGKPSSARTLLIGRHAPRADGKPPLAASLRQGGYAGLAVPAPAAASPLVGAKCSRGWRRQWAARRWIDDDVSAQRSLVAVPADGRCLLATTTTTATAAASSTDACIRPLSMGVAAQLHSDYKLRNAGTCSSPLRGFVDGAGDLPALSRTLPIGWGSAPAGCPQRATRGLVGI